MDQSTENHHLHSDEGVYLYNDTFDFYENKMMTIQEANKKVKIRNTQKGGRWEIRDAHSYRQWWHTQPEQVNPPKHIESTWLLPTPSLPRLPACDYKLVGVEPRDTTEMEMIAVAERNGFQVGSLPKMLFMWQTHWHMASHLYLKRSNGSVLVTRRAKSKRLFPGCWTFAVSGTRNAKESYFDCIVRETTEELGISPEISPEYTYLRTEVRNSLKCHDAIFQACCDDAVNPDEREVDDFCEVKNDQYLLEELQSGYLSPYTPGLRQFLEAKIKSEKEQ
jgi:isopentenyldiphosphate isomerase